MCRTKKGKDKPLVLLVDKIGVSCCDDKADWLEPEGGKREELGWFRESAGSLYKSASASLVVTQSGGSE